MSRVVVPGAYSMACPRPDAHRPVNRGCLHDRRLADNGERRARLGVGFENW
jgi:hypothetical protein